MTYLVPVIILTIFLAFSAQGQGKDTYQLYKGGEYFKKPVAYLTFGTDDRKKVDDEQGKVQFYLDGETFEYKYEKSEIDTISVEEACKFQFINTHTLAEREYEEYKRAAALENWNLAPPPNHYIMKIYIIEFLNNKLAIKYNVDWKFAVY